MNAYSRTALVILALGTAGACSPFETLEPAGPTGANDSAESTVTSTNALRRSDPDDDPVDRVDPVDSVDPVDTTGPSHRAPAEQIPSIVEPPDVAPRMVPDDRMSTLATGPGWQRVRAKGRFQPLAPTESGDVDDEYIIIENLAGLTQADLPALIKDSVRAALNTNGEPVVLSKNALVKAEAKAREIGELPTVMARCSSDVESIPAAFSRTVPFNFQKNFSAGSDPNRFSGSAQLSGSVSVALGGTVSYRYVRGWLCAPVGVRFMGIGASGSTNLRATGRLAGQFTGAMKYRKELFTVPLGSFGYKIPLIDIGIGVTFDLPLSVGFEAGGAITATVVSGLDAGAEIHASCLRDSGCETGGSSHLNFVNEGVPSVGVNGRMNVNVFAEAAIRGRVLVIIPVAGVEIGIGARLKNQLWGYAGNSCGDADGDGSNEFVTGALMDTRAVIDLFARVNLLGSNVLESSKDLVDKHLHTFDLGGKALDPVLKVTPMVLHQHFGSGKVVVEAGMRSCYPFPAALGLSWGDGQAENVSSSAHATFSRTHQYVDSGWRTVGLTIESNDNAPSFNRATQTTFYVNTDMPIVVGSK